MDHLKVVSVGQMTSREKKAFFLDSLISWLFNVGTSEEHCYIDKKRNRKFFYLLTNLPENRYAIYQDEKVFIIKGVESDNTPILEGTDVYYSPLSQARIQGRSMTIVEGDLMRGVISQVKRYYPYA